MPSVTVEVRATVSLHMSEKYAKKITLDDIKEMASDAIGNGEAGKGVQIVLDGVAQWESDKAYEKSLKDGDCSGAIFSDVNISAWDTDIEFQECDEEFEKLPDY